MNWDTVAEERILELKPDLTIAYGNGFVRAGFPTEGHTIVRVPTTKRPRLRIAKIHGSINWLYCDNCRSMYWFPPDESLKIADQILGPEEWKRIAPRAPANAKEQLECDHCERVKLGTRIATFSYRKALDFPMFHQSWNNAETLLVNARRWVFIGYSLPAADYEFKYLLKRIELARANNPPDIILVTGGDAADITRKNYRRFFGNLLNKEEFNDGLQDDATEYLTS